MKRKLKLFIVIMLTITLPFFLTGCWNSREINSLGFITTMGIDKTEKGVLLTVQVLNPRAIALQKPVNEPTVIVYKQEGKDIYEMIHKMIAKSSRELNLTHLQTVVFGEEYAKDGISNVLDFIMREHQFRTNIYFTVAKGSTASDVLNCLTKLDTNPSVKLVFSIKNSNKTWAGSSSIKTVELINTIKAAGKNPVLTGIRLNEISPKNDTIDNLKYAQEDSIEIKDLSVFRKDKLAGWLNERESKGYKYIMGNVSNTVEYINSKKTGNITTEVTDTKSDTKVSFVNGKPKITVNIKVKANIEAALGNLDITKAENIKKIEKFQERKIADMCNKSIAKAQKDLNSDIFGFGEEIHRSYPKLWNSMKRNWGNEFKQLPVKVNVSYKIIKTGTISKSVVKE